MKMNGGRGKPQFPCPLSNPLLRFTKTVADTPIEFDDTYCIQKRDTATKKLVIKRAIQCIQYAAVAARYCFVGML